MTLNCSFLQFLKICLGNIARTIINRLSQVQDATLAVRAGTPTPNHAQPESYTGPGGCCGTGDRWCSWVQS